MKLRNMTLYSIFVRNHGGSFRAVAEDIPRIRALGVDAVWLLPIHPIGREKRKGSLGSPYAISDYRAVNPEYGTMEHFQALADTVHANGMKLLIDVVYHHTSPDSWLARNHPEWFYHKPDGSFGNRVGDWTDIIDLDFEQKDLWNCLTETLKQWAAIVDGFRCDVAPLVPLEFWLEARRAVEQVRPGCIWLAESVEAGFLTYAREHSMTALTDGELYQAFDVCYDYDVSDEFEGYIRGDLPLADYLAALDRQRAIYPAGFVKLRFLENHDRPRMAALLPTARLQRNWLSWSFFQQGMALLYSGQEWAPVKRPDLFEPDPIAMPGEPVHGALIRRLAAMKKDPVFADGVFSCRACPNDLVLASCRLGARRAVGLFSLKGKPGTAPVELPDGQYENLTDGGTVSVESGQLTTDGEPIILML